MSDFDFEDAPGSSDSGSKREPPAWATRTIAQPPGPDVSDSDAEPAYITALNERQKQAARITEGPLIVLAGAGSGKTKMLTSRIAYLMDRKRVPAHQILAVTFTNKAAAEMRERVERHLHGSSYLGTPEIGTFHAVCVRILRREMAHTPFTKPFVIYDDSDQLSLIKDVVEKMGLDSKSFSPKSFQYAINRLKCDATEPHELTPAAHNIFDRHLKRVYELYQKELFSNNALDFGEIITMVYRLFRDQTEVRAKYQRLYRYVHVDEYQDTNRAQYLLLSMLAGSRGGGHQNLCVVGDEDQSIYKWRGADIRNILDFEQDFPGAEVVKLEQNYRSTKTIVTAASHLIRNNKERKDKTLWTDNEDGIAISRVQLPDERAEAEMVVSELKRIAESEGRTYAEFAIFYRTHAQSRQFEDVLRREKINYQIVGGLRFYDRKEIKDILSYFKVILNPTDSVSLKRIINVPARGIGKTTIDKIEAVQGELQAEGAHQSQGELQMGGARDTSFWAALVRASLDASLTSKATARKLSEFTQFIERLVVEQPKLMLSELYHLILDETGYVRGLRQENTEEATSRIENLEEFDSLLQEFEEDLFEKTPEGEREKKKAELLSLFIEQSSLMSQVDENAPLQSSVNLMTLHSSKGLEFPVVFLVGMEEGLFPSVRPWEETPDEDIEEERRLCYVGMTRARERLYLMHVVVRRIWGNVSYQEPARFFTEIPAELVDFRDLAGGAAAGAFRAGSSRHFGGEFGRGGGSGRGDYGESDDRDSASSAGGRDSAGSGRGVGSAGWRDSASSGGDSGWKKNPLFEAATSAAAKFAPTYSGGSQSLVGERIVHPDYGRGTIVLAEGSGDATKVIIEFKGRDRRKFLFRYIQSFLEE